MTELGKKVIETISTQKLSPRPAYVFLAKRSVFWALALFSIFFGAVSFAILLFAISDFFATGWRVLDNIHFNEVLLAIPALWLVLLGAFTASAAYGFRHTRRGYRFRTIHIAGLSLAAGMGLGTILYASNAAYDLHEYLERNFPAYHDFTYVPFAEWSRPDEGSLGGTVVSGAVDGHIKVRDFQDNIWDVDVSSALIDLDSDLLDEGDIAIEGERTGPDSFRARKIGEFD